MAIGQESPQETFPIVNWQTLKPLSKTPGADRTGPAVTVIVVNYNGRRFLDELLQGLQRQSYSDFETLLIDNASSDGSADYVRQNYPGVQVVAQSQNLGFSTAANRGVRRSRARWVALLNTDLKLDPNWLQELVRVGESDPEIAAVAGKMRLYDRPALLNGVGGCMNRLGYTWDRGMLEPDRGQYDRPAEVLFACAGAALFRRQTFLQVGGFDRRFFMYHEDVDLGWRLWLLGFRILTAPRAVVYHHFGGTTGQCGGRLWRELMGERHNLRTLLKNYQWRNLLPCLWQLLLLPQRPYRKAQQLVNFLWNLVWLPETLLARRRIQKQRSRNDRELARLIVQSQNVPIRL